MAEFVALPKSHSFFEKVALLLITAGLTGVLIPTIDSRLSESRLRDQMVFEEQLQRQHDVLNAQIELLRNLSKLTWEFQLMNINVSFYRLNGDETDFQIAVERYQNNSGTLLGQIRAELSISRRLVSPEMYERLAGLYFDTLLPIDSSLEWLIKQDAETLDNEWQEQHNRSFGDAQTQIDEVLNELAVELQLTATAAS